MSKERVIAEVRTADQAKRVEETIKTGYIEVCIENLVNWMAVEDDIASSYSELSRTAAGPAKEAFQRLHSESRADVQKLGGLVATFEGLNKQRIARIELLRNLGK